MKILKIRVTGLPLFNKSLEIDFYAQQRVSPENDEGLYKLFSYNNSSVYLNNAIGVVGINASGKTTTLKVISFVIDMLNSKPINDISNKTILNGLAEGQKVQFETFFYCKNNTLNKIETVIKACVDEQSKKRKYIIEDEKFWTKNASTIRSKKKMFEFEKQHNDFARDQKEDFLLEDVSISVAIRKRYEEDKIFFWNMLDLTNHTEMNIIGNFPHELIEFLDPSIEWLKFDNIEEASNGDDCIIRLKFKNKKEIVMRETSELCAYLSSGTIKGCNIFMNAFFTFKTGGYLIVDEIENHFNREIVSTLIRFFVENDVNGIGGTIIFSTHYTELLDIFERNDSIYLIRNREGICAENLSNLLKRNDIKKSEAYDSGYLEGTVPMYDAYIKLKKCLL